MNDEELETLEFIEIETIDYTEDLQDLIESSNESLPQLETLNENIIELNEYILEKNKSEEELEEEALEIEQQKETISNIEKGTLEQKEIIEEYISEQEEINLTNDAMLQNFQSLLEEQNELLGVIVTQFDLDEEQQLRQEIGYQSNRATIALSMLAVVFFIIMIARYLLTFFTRYI